MGTDRRGSWNDTETIEGDRKPETVNSEENCNGESLVCAALDSKVRRS